LSPENRIRVTSAAMKTSGLWWPDRGGGDPGAGGSRQTKSQAALKTSAFSVICVASRVQAKAERASHRFGNRHGATLLAERFPAGY
jgi:hypothetical protein